ncbi:alpha-glucosidase [Bacillaceae bacterium Marseille-Q3522]|nr:alpha-glucosidase [Bacillaceae bacterium Marseille-Q3522]
MRQWWKESVVYQIYPRSFYDTNGDGIGDIQGIIAKLDYLKKLGITVIWLCPVYPSPDVDNGYDISDYRGIHPEFGTMKDWDHLLLEMHKRGMKLIMDLVVNHTSDQHKWFLEAKKSKTNPYRDYYIWRPPLNGQEPSDWQSNFGGSAWEYDRQTGEYYLHLFTKQQPDLNWDNRKVRQEVYDIMRFWLEKGIDGFRMDVIGLIAKKGVLPAYNDYLSGKAAPLPFIENNKYVHTYLHEMNREVLSKYDIMTVGETPGVDPEEAKKYTADQRRELNMVFQFEHMSLDKQPGKRRWDLKKLNLIDLKENLSKWQKGLDTEGWNSLYWSNHDQPRIVSRFGDEGKYRKQSAKMLASVLHMMKGTPYIYQGEELGMTNVRFKTIVEYNDVETINMYHERTEKGYPEEDVMASVYAKGRDNGRTPMHWNSGKHAGFTTGTPWLKLNPRYTEINAEEALTDPESIFYYYQKLIELRKQNEIIVYGSYELILDDNRQIFAYLRRYKKQLLLVINNFYQREAIFQLPSSISFRTSMLLITNYPHHTVENLQEFTLLPYESRVYLLEVD